VTGACPNLIERLLSVGGIMADLPAQVALPRLPVLVSLASDLKLLFAFEFYTCCCMYMLLCRLPARFSGRVEVQVAIYGAQFRKSPTIVSRFISTFSGSRSNH
jgi:hypothetical protein